MSKTLHWAILPPVWDDADAAAIRACMVGEASKEQQARAMKWIIEKACGTYEWAFDPNSQRNTEVALGRQFVGKQIIALPLKLDVIKTSRRQLK